MKTKQIFDNSENILFLFEFVHSSIRKLSRKEKVSTPKRRGLANKRTPGILL